MTYDPTPAPREPQNPAMHLALTQQQIQQPHQGATAPLPPTRSLGGWLWQHGGRIAPGLVSTSAWGLALAWHQQLPVGGTEPLWLMGGFTALAALAGLVSAAKPHGSEGITGTAFAAAGVSAMVGVAAWTPNWPVSVLMWVLATAAAYGLCAPHWRNERQQTLSHTHAVQMEQVRGYNEWARTVTEVSGQIEVEKWRTKREEAVVEQIVAASDARTARQLAPGEELNVAALLRAAGASAPAELSAIERKGDR